MVEIFADRIEITNPGAPLVDMDRFVDTPPRSRNEALASLMRRFGICEERGSGWDKIVFQTEYYQLPAPLPEATCDHTRVVLFAHRPLTKMDKADRIRGDRYIKGFKKVQKLHRDGIPAENIASELEMSKSLVRQYVEIVEDIAIGAIGEKE